MSSISFCLLVWLIQSYPVEYITKLPFHSCMKVYRVNFFFSPTGIAMVDGPVWKEQRKFTVSVFRDIGVGKLNFEDKIQSSISHLLEYLKANDGELIDPADQINKSVANVIGNIVFGSENYERNSDETVKYISCVDENFRNVETAGMMDDFPFLYYLPGDLFLVQKTKDNVSYMLEYGYRSVAWHRENPPPDDEPRDFIDAYLQRMAQNDSKRYDFSGNSSNHLSFL